jgi:hypothetical protein
VLEPTDGGVFDVRDPNVALNGTKRRDNFASAVAATFCLATVALLLVFDLGRAMRRQLPAFGAFILVVTVVWLFGIAYMLIWGIRRKQPGAESVRVDGRCMVLEIPGRAQIRALWSDPELRFELHDLSSVNPGMLSVRTPYFLKVGGTHSALSQGTFEAILAQTKSHALVDRFEPASRWFSPSGAMRHVVSGKAAS